ncbi:MAG TPA: ATP-dependent helicase HrpB [Pirellulales bacterium]|jgi:ATP-dependent helicase HrpB|nr:ATP-dependent helicase HrpB [Pirellulales bacterium]
MSLPRLPIDEVLPQLLAALRTHPCAVLKAPTGAGKTTRVPPALLDACIGPGQILLLQPRRIAARAAAWRMASERGTALGSEIGYHVRFERRASADTKIIAMTAGLFLRRLQDDPFLEQIAAVLFDEFHERTLDSDLSLAMARRVQTELRPELKLVVMSATLDPAPIARFLGDCPCLESAGRSFPISISYSRHESREPCASQVAAGVKQVFSETSGDVLAFLPGVGEIRRAAAELAAWAAAENVCLAELYGELPLERQQAVLQRGAQRKVVLATNVAETSLTIEGVTAVVDAGLARIQRIDPGLGLNRLMLERISQAAAAQRAGRAGRTAPGICLRLWTESRQRALAEHETPEIARLDLAAALLHLLGWDDRGVDEFAWFDPPPPPALAQARELLERLGATNRGRLTPLGRRLAKLPVEPRLGRMLCEGARLGHVKQLALAAALLSERDPFRTGASRARAAHDVSDSDLVDRVQACEDSAQTGRLQTALGPLERAALKQISRSRDQLLAAVLKADDFQAPPDLRVESNEALRRAALAAFADRVARRREPNSRRAIMVGGRGVRLHEQSAVREARLFVCIELEETGAAEALVRQASAIERDWLPPELLSTTIDVEFDHTKERVVALRRIRFLDLVLDEAATNVPDDFELGPVLAQAAAERLDANFFQDDEGLNYLARVRCLARWMPELGLPEWGDDPLRRLLPKLCQGARSIDEVRRAQLASVVQSQLTAAQRAAVERETPERIAVPSGSRIALKYEFLKPPVLAVRIQEVFGLRQTPRVAGGRIAVLMHLLAPNHRPQQVTSDLESFWRTAYAEVRKELRRRYPKHAWPEDPTQADAQRRPGKR